MLLPHVNGLPLPENTQCEIRSYANKYEFISGTTNIVLPREKVTDMCIKTDEEIENQIVSSIGGAIVGGALFGTLGAAIGGRAKTKQVKTVTNYLIITYLKNENELTYICFEIPYNPPSFAEQLVKEFHELNTNSGIQIDL